MASYTLGEKLREGRRAVTYRALRDDDGHPVVLKLLPSSPGDSQDVEHLRHELELGRAVDSPAVVKVLALDTREGRPALVLEDTGGVSLDRVLGADEAMPTERFLELAVGLARAVASFHALGLIHKDLKPESFVVSRATGEVQITDLGIATRSPREQTAPRAARLIEGSLAYMSPEQTGRMNRPVDSRSDLYSLGVTFFRMLTGRLPFEAADPLGWVHCHIARRPPAPAELVPSVPATLSKVVVKLLAKLPEERYQSAAGLEHDLARCLRDWCARGAIAPFPLGERDWSGRLFVPRKLYGREAEVAELLAAFERVVARNGSELVLVSGFSGVGKSSLVQELHVPIVLRRGAFASAKFDQLRREVPYSTLLQACRELLQEVLVDTEEGIAASRRALGEHLGPNAQVLVEILPELGLVLGPQPPAPTLPLADAERRLFDAFRQFFGAFAKEERPLTIFLDDLQWADPATLRVLEHLLVDADLRPFLLLGAYRDNEVGASHPLVRMIERVRVSGVAVRDLELGPLSVVDFTRLLADTLHASPEDVARLARLVHSRTGGNPFFAIHFLATLESRGLLSFDRTLGAWRWDVTRIEAQGFTDNVVDLLVGKVRLLPAATQEALKLCACLGSAIDSGTLAAITGRAQNEIEVALEPALEQDLLLHVEGHFRFSHDRVQEAAYSLVPADERPATHLKIGRILARAASEELEERIFDVVDQLNRGAALIEAGPERDRLAELDLRAGRRAKASAAFANALAYLEKGISSLSPDAWETRYELSFALHFEAAQCAFGSGSTTDAAERIRSLRERARTRRHVVDVACLEISLATLGGDQAHAVEVALDGLRLFGIEWPVRPPRALALAEYEELERRLLSCSIEQLVDLPRMEDPDALALMSLLTAVHSPALFTDLNLVSLLTCRMVNLSFERGNADSSSHAYSTLGMLVGPVFGKYGEAPRWGKLGIALVEERGGEVNARVYIDASLSSQWDRHLRAARELQARALDAALQVGDLMFACYAHNLTITVSLALGAALDDVDRATVAALAFVRKIGFGLVETIVTSEQRLVRNLRGQTAHFSTFDDETFDERRFEAALEANVAFSIATCWYFIWKLVARFFSGDYEEASRAAERAERLLWTSPSFIEASEFHFFHALTLAARLDDLPTEERAAALATLRDRAALLADWAELCPENFAHKHALVAAELARAEGRNERAAELYERAIRAASDNGFVHHEGVSLEVASRFYRARGFGRIADAYLRDARACYVRWGADGKVDQLDRLFPNLVEQRVAQPTTTLALHTEQLDLLSIFKASQTISSVIDREQLLRTLLEVVLEQGGARTARLVFVEGDRLTLEAEASVDGEGVKTRLLGSQPLAASTACPVTIMNYVRRTKERVVLEDAASRPGRFADDAYLARQRPRSLLCLPIVRQTEVKAILHLENDLVPGAFTTDRLVALELLASQAAISLENALLLGRERSARREARFLADASKTMAGSLDYRETLTRLARLAVPFLADWCVVDVVEEGQVRRVAGAHVDPSKEPLLQELEEHTADGARRRPAAQALATGEPYMAPELTEEDLLAMTADASHAEVVRALNPRSVIAVPLIVRGERLGAMTFSSSRPGFRHGPEAIALAEEVARRAAVAIENARLYEEATRAIQLRDEFLSVASHELRTPVTSLLLTVQALAAGHAPCTPQSVRRACRLIERQATRLAELIDEMLSVGSAHLGRPELDLADVDLVAAVNDVVQRLRPLLARAGCPLEVRAPAPVVGRWDDRKLAHVITNLLANALKFGAGRPIEVSVDAIGGRARLAVTDHGIGIAPEALSHIFEKFARAVSARQYGGLGIGLYVVQEVVQAHGGSVRAESVPRSYTTITVELPLEGPPHP